MRMGTKVLLGSIVALLVLPLTASAGNLIQNGDFETGDLTDWLVFGQSASSDVVVLSGDNGPTEPGTYHAFMDNQAEAMGLTLKQSTPAGSALPGTVYYSYDLKLDQADVGGVLFVQIFAEQAGGGIIYDSGLFGPYWTWNAWSQIGGSFEAPAGTDFLTIQFMCNTGAAVGSNCLMHVDNVSLLQDASATENTSWGGIKALYR